MSFQARNQTYSFLLECLPNLDLYCRTSLIRTPKGQSKASVLERCPLYGGYEYYVTLKAPLMVSSVL